MLNVGVADLTEHQDSTPPSEPLWLTKLQKSAPFVVCVFLGGLLGTLADRTLDIYDRLKRPDSFVLAENTARSNFSDQLARRAWLRLFWADNFRARVENQAPLADIDAAWAAYISADADWNANIMISIVGLEQYYGDSRSNRLEGRIQNLFGTLDNQLAALRRSEIVKKLREGNLPTDSDVNNASLLAQQSKDTSDALRSELYILVRCFSPEKRGENLCGG